MEYLHRKQHDEVTAGSPSPGTSEHYSSDLLVLEQGQRVMINAENAMSSTAVEVDTAFKLVNKDEMARIPCVATKCAETSMQPA